MLKGQKVLLRPVEREDLKRMHELHANVELEIFGGGGDWSPRSFASYEKWYDKQLEKQQSWFAIEADGKMIGDMGLHHESRQDQATSFGIGIGDLDYVGKGYGREAMRLFLDYVFRIRGWRRIWLETSANNERAIRAYKAIGFVEEGRLRQHTWSNGNFEDAIVMGLLKREWDALQAINVSDANDDDGVPTNS